jgi:hypothetical protein
MASLVLTGDTSGQVTIAAPAVAGTTTLTLPATTGTVLNDATVGVCRAWVNFNGTGTVAIRASFNVTSITDNGTGDYTVNFTTALANANYAFLVTPTSSTAAANGNAVRTITTISTSAFRFVISNGSAIADVDYVNVAIFL